MATESIDIGAIIQGGTGISEVVSGMLVESKTRDALEEHRKTRPIYEIPSSIQEQIEILRQRAEVGLPGADLIGQQIQQGTGRSVGAAREAATSAADLLGATTQAYGQETQALTQLEIENARARSSNQLALAQGLGNRAAYEEQAFIYNEAIPYDVRMNELMGIQQSAYDLITGGISTIAQSGANFSGGSGSSPQIQSDINTNQSTSTSGFGLGYQPTSLGETYTGPTLGQAQYNPSGAQTLGQYQYNPTGEQTLGQYIYG